MSLSNISLSNITSFSFSENRSGIKLNIQDMQQPSTIINIIGDEIVYEERDKFCEFSMYRKFDKLEKELDGILEDLSNNWISKNIFRVYFTEIKKNIEEAESILNRMRDSLRKQDHEERQESIDKDKSEIADIIESINTNSPSNHEVLNGMFDLLVMVAIGGWTYFVNNKKLDTATTDYIFIPLALNASPNVIKLLILLRNKIIKFYLVRREILKSILISMRSILEECEKKNYHAEDKDIIKEAEKNIIFRLSEEIRRQNIFVDQKFPPTLSLGQEILSEIGSSNNHEARGPSFVLSIEKLPEANLIA